ncbi:MAG: tRNA 2-thiouridine(34) synthase MnmA [Proteobacteria bacterium]|nr:tRNA 2-thiouridine(34) synthase MnmA [Pseudomonadota bacterium]
MNSLTAVALSGGIDSLVASVLLKEEKRDVIAIHFRTGIKRESSHLKDESILFENRIRAAAEVIGIPLVFIDVSEQFRFDVVRYFVSEYENGRTPNPCMVCNRQIKFGKLLNRARFLGADCLATGHYARVVSAACGRSRLLKAIDPNKDQSYFLALLSRNQLKFACFPLGTYTREDVRRIAERVGIIPFVTEESQEVCFVEGNAYSAFLKKEGMAGRPGPIIDRTGKMIGTHRGLCCYTIGQRRGIGIPAAEPYYVIRIDIAANRLVVGRKPELRADECEVDDINWIALPPDRPVRVSTRIRYRHKEAPSTLFPGDDTKKAIIRFDTAQEAVTPGQAAVFFKGEEVLGGGWIL